MTDEPCSPRVTIERSGLSQDVAVVEPGLLLQHLELVVVADDDRRADDAFAQLVAGHPRALLARIEDVADAERPALVRVLHHRAGIVRRDDREVRSPPIDRNDSSPASAIAPV